MATTHQHCDYPDLHLCLLSIDPPGDVIDLQRRDSRRKGSAPALGCPRCRYGGEEGGCARTRARTRGAPRGIPRIFAGIWERDNSSCRAELSRRMQLAAANTKTEFNLFPMVHVQVQEPETLPAPRQFGKEDLRIGQSQPVLQNFTGAPSPPPLQPQTSSSRRVDSVK